MIMFVFFALVVVLNSGALAGDSVSLCRCEAKNLRTYTLVRQDTLVEYSLVYGKDQMLLLKERRIEGEERGRWNGCKSLPSEQFGRCTNVSEGDFDLEMNLMASRYVRDSLVKVGRSVGVRASCIDTLLKIDSVLDWKMNRRIFRATLTRRSSEFVSNWNNDARMRIQTMLDACLSGGDAECVKRVHP